ncbi:MAG: hypothetical protein HC906_07610 [Bacteroidales bacterium]|nr:hypothetical protein [Bacteroidales bacterium]
MTSLYAERLQQVYASGHNSSVEYPVTYPGPAPKNFQYNPLSGQLRIIARLLNGGIKTRIFLCTLGGFDTHGNQVDKTTIRSERMPHCCITCHRQLKHFRMTLQHLDLKTKYLP